MRRAIAALALALCTSGAAAQSGWWEGFKSHVEHNVEQSKAAVHHGRHDVYLGGLIWHAPWAYSAERRTEENEAGWGLGFGKSVIDDNNRTHGLYGLVHRDSNYKPQYNFGYSWTTYWDLGRNFDAGLGYSAFIFMRSDFASYFPIPAVLPLATLRWDKRAELMGTFVPGFGDNGNVLYVFARFSFP